MKKNSQNILILGSSISKLIWIDQAKKMVERGFNTLFFVRSKTEFSPQTESIKTLEIPENIFSHWIRFYKILKEYRPHHIEAYHDLFRWDFLLSYWVYIKAAKLFNIPIISICMGGEILYWKKHFFLKKWSIKALLKASKLIIVKEPYHREYIQSYNILGSKNIPLVDIPNAVDIHEEASLERNEDILLYLNSFKSWRHPEIVIKAFHLIKKKCPQAKLVMAGYRTKEELALIQKDLSKDLQSSITFFPYNLENRKLFSQAKVFMLPADLIFLNNSLLEAMERGVPAVVGNRDKHAGKIIENGKNGFIVDITPESVAKHIILLLEDETLRRKIGEEARKTVKKGFNSKDRIDKLISIYQSL